MAICSRGSAKHCSLGCGCKTEVVHSLRCLECGRGGTDIEADQVPRCRFCGSTMIDLVSEVPPVVDYRDTPPF